MALHTQNIVWSFDSDSDAEHVHQYLRAAIKWSRAELTTDEYRKASSFHEEIQRTRYREEEEVGKDPTVRPGGPPERMKTRATSPIAVQLQVQARDGLIPIDPFAVANERELGVDQ
jgi:hypothetical protein